MDPIRLKAVGYFNAEGTTSLIVPTPLGWRPVVTGLDVSSDAAATVALLLGGTVASIAVDQAGANNELTFRAKRGGDSGEGFSVEIVENGNLTALTIVTTINAVPAGGGYDIDFVINLATDGAGNGISTAGQVIAAFNADATASLYAEALPTTTAETVVGALSADSGPTAFAGATPDQVWSLAFADAFVLPKSFPPGEYAGPVSGDVKVTVSAGTDLINVSGFYIPGD